MKTTNTHKQNLMKLKPGSERLLRRHLATKWILAYSTAAGPTRGDTKYVICIHFCLHFTTEI